MKATMLAAKLIAPGKLAIQSIPKPIIHNPKDVLLRMIHVGLCGSDLHYFRHGAIGDQVIDSPFIIGHEGVAIVEETGHEVKELKPGDKVVFNPAISCGQCDQCLEGRPHTCRRLKFLGCPGQLEGCLQEFIIMPEKNCFLINEEIVSFAVLVEPIAIALYAAHMAGPINNKKVVIFGCGPIGLSLLLHCHLSGANMIAATDKVQARLEQARRFGAHWVGNPDLQDVVDELKLFLSSDTQTYSSEFSPDPSQFDLAFDCCGDQQALDQAISILKPGGKLIIIGIPETNQIFFDPHLLRRKEITIHNVRRQNNFFPQAIKFLEDNQKVLKPLITHHFSLKDVQKALAIASNYQDGIIKAVVDM